MGRWDDRTCANCGEIHDCKFYEDLKRSLDEQLKRYEIMMNWFTETINKIVEEKIDKGFPSELSDK